MKHCHKLETVLKITAKKKNPDIITFKFGMGAGEVAVVTEQLRFRIPNTHKATEAIKEPNMEISGPTAAGEKIASFSCVDCIYQPGS